MSSYSNDLNFSSIQDAYRQSQQRNLATFQPLPTVTTTTVIGVNERPHPGLRVNDEYKCEELIVRSSDAYIYENNGGKYPGLPKVNKGRVCYLDRLIVNNCMMSIKKDTSLSICFKFYLNRSKYSGVETTNSVSVIPNINPVATQLTAIAEQNTDFVLNQPEYIVLPISINIPAGDYTSSQLAMFIENTFNGAGYSKALNFRHSAGDTIAVATNGGYNYQFRLKVDLNIVNQKLKWTFTLWNQVNAALVTSKPEFRLNNTIALIITNSTKNYTSYIYSQLSYHDIYVSGDNWLLEKMGFTLDVAANQSLKIKGTDYTAPLYTSTLKAPVMDTTAIVGFNDITGYLGATFQSQEVLDVQMNRLFDIKHGSNVVMSIEKMNHLSGQLHDPLGRNHNAIHYINLKMFSFGAIIEEFPNKPLLIDVFDNSFKISFADDHGDPVDAGNLNYIASFKIYQTGSKVMN